MVLIRNRLRNCLELLCKSKHSKGMHRSVENVQYSALHPVRDASLTGCKCHTWIHFLPSDIPYGNKNVIFKQFLKLLPVILLTFTAVACRISYSFTGASISPQIKTLSVQRFYNRAANVTPGLDQYLTDALIDKCKAQTNLRIVRDLGDVDFEGEITDYRTQPVTIGVEAYAETNRFTITVRVKFTNTVEPHLSYDQSFSAYEDYPGEKTLSEVEQDLYVKIFDKIVEDIFNRAFVNW